MKNKKCVAGYFASLFSCFVSLFSLFAFLSISYQGRHSPKKSKDFGVYFFAALIKHKIRMKCEECTVSVLYFVVCFAKNTREMRKVYSRPNRNATIIGGSEKVCNSPERGK